jgi:hypothetical protein
MEPWHDGQSAQCLAQDGGEIIAGLDLSDAQGGEGQCSQWSTVLLFASVCGPV